MTNEEVAKKVRLLRETRGMTQDDLAQLIGRHRITVARLEAGKPVQRSVLIAMAQALTVPTTELMDDADGATIDAEAALARTRVAMDCTRIPVYPKDAVMEQDPQAQVTMVLPTAMFAPTVTRSIDARRLFATEAGNNRLAPTIQTGDLVIVERDARVGDGIGLYATDGGADFFTHADGPAGDRPIGRAVGVFRRI